VWKSWPFTGWRRKRTRPKRHRGPAPSVAEVTERQRFGRITPLREDNARGKGGRLAEAGRPRVKTRRLTGFARACSRGFGSRTRRGYSSLKTEECGLHVPARRACRDADRGPIRVRGRRTSCRRDGRPRWCERLSSSVAKRVRVLRKNPGQGEFVATPKGSTLRDGCTGRDTSEWRLPAP
jgi:hypothetical protein